MKGILPLLLSPKTVDTIVCKAGGRQLKCLKTMTYVVGGFLSTALWLDQVVSVCIAGDVGID